MDGSLNHDIIRSMSAKAFELEAQLVSLQMTLRTQNDLISVFVRNMEEEINVATYRAKSELESASLHLKLEQEKVSSVYDSAKERLSYVAKSVFLPVFQKIDMLYSESINRLEYIKREYENTKSVVYNIRNISAWTPFDAPLQQLSKERVEYENKRNSVEYSQNTE